MYRSAPRHPLHSFKFWFLVLACVATTTAWRMGWFPAAEQDEPAVAEVDLTESASRPDSEADAVADIAAGQMEPPYFPPPQTDAATLDPWAGPAAVANATPPREAPRPSRTQTSAETPFGPRDLEFVPADTFARTPEVAAPEIVAPPVAAPSDIVQVAGIETAPVVEDPVGAVQQEFAADVAQANAAVVDWASLDRMINAGEDIEAHRQLSSLYWDRPELRAKVLPRIQQTSQRIYFQPQPHYMDAYVVQGGDVLENIAKQYGVTWQYLAKLNRTDPRRIRAGQQLKVAPGPFGAVVDLRRFEMTVHANGWFVAHFPIGIGKDGSTPVGEFTVLDKLEDPTYYGPDQVIANDDPMNPLGEFWMSLGNGYGIHGTIDEGSIGRAESRGCIRLRNQDVADCYDLLSIGSPVIIRR